MRTWESSRPDSRGTGPGNSTYCVSTVPTDPGSRLDSVAAGAIMSVFPEVTTVYYPDFFTLDSEKGGAMSSTIDNGVNVQALLEAREVLAGAPEAAQFTWKASSR